MKRVLILIVAISIITACTSNADATATQPSIPTDVPPASTSTPEADPVLLELTEPVAISTVPALKDDFFSENGITLPAPTCSALTVAQTEGPYYTPNSPERNNLLEEGMPGTRLFVVGYVLDQNCQPLANAWLDFWQADANGDYDNVGYRLRGHQFTDEQGRYYLQTVLPGEYPGRTQHIHVKVQPNGGSLITSQLYFPNSPGIANDGIFDPTLIVQLEERLSYILAYFNFVVQ